MREPLPWLYRTAFRVAAAELRRYDRLASGEAPDARADLQSALPSDVTAVLAELSPPQRLVIFLHYYAGMSIREIASLSGAPSATVKVRLHRARRTLRDRLQEEGVARV